MKETFTNINEAVQKYPSYKVITKIDTDVIEADRFTNATYSSCYIDQVLCVNEESLYTTEKKEELIDKFMKKYINQGYTWEKAEKKAEETVENAKWKDCIVMVVNQNYF